MKGKDDHKLFEVFQPGVRDDLTFWQKLAYWFQNVYWCNYRTHTLVGLFAAIMLVILICDVTHRVDNDLDYILAGDAFVSNEQMETMTKVFSEIVQDVNGDGKVTVGYQMLATGGSESYDQLATAAEQKLSVSLADDRYLFYVVDKKHMEQLATAGAFEPLENFDISSENRFCLALAKSGLDLPEVEGGWFIGIKMIDDSRAKDAETMKKYHAAANILEQLAGS